MELTGWRSRLYFVMQARAGRLFMHARGEVTKMRTKKATKKRGDATNSANP
jgi:hypothetical protein